MNVKAEHISQMAIALYKIGFLSISIFLASDIVRLSINHASIFSISSSAILLINVMLFFRAAQKIDWNQQIETLKAESTRDWKSDPAGVGTLAAKGMVLIGSFLFSGVAVFLLWKDLNSWWHPSNYRPVDIGMQVWSLLLAICLLLNSILGLVKDRAKWLILTVRWLSMLAFLACLLVFAVINPV
jgi:hypothetical protein